MLVAATTENPSFSVIAPLLSRSLLLTLRAADRRRRRRRGHRAVADPRGLDGASRSTDDARDHRAAGLGRRAPGADRPRGRGRGGRRRRGTGRRPTRCRADHPRPERAGRGPRRRALRPHGDEHYDVASALIKSMRGSDVDAALHYLARMIEAGEDPRFIARRLVIAASEDIGMADPTALQIAVAACTRWPRSGCRRGASPWPRRWCTSRPRRSRTPRTSASTRRSPTCAPAGRPGARPPARRALPRR